jgi:hypothetical protein
LKKQLQNFRVNMSMSASVDSTKIKEVIEKLLNKAGKDPRVTLKILRTKAESKLQLPSGSLKEHRQLIKDTIWEWWEADQSHVLTQFVYLARAHGLAPAILKGMKEIPSVTGRLEILQER